MTKLKVNIEIKGKNEFEHIFTILQIGLLTALENDLISIEESERYLFNPYILKLLQEHGINKNITNVIHLGCELEDVESLLPHILLDNITKLKKDSMNILKNLEKQNSEVEKLIKKITD